MKYIVSISYYGKFEFDDGLTALNFSCVAMEHTTDDLDHIAIYVHRDGEGEGNDEGEEDDKE